MTTLTETAEQIRVDAAALHAQIRNNRDLSADAVRRQMAIVHTAAVSDMANAQQSSQANDARDMTAAQNAAWGIDDIASPGSPDRAAVSMSYRDAQDRADQIEIPAEAVRQVERANATGDELVARALAHKAWDNAALLGGGEWQNVLDLYVSTRPKAAAALDQLAALRNTPSALLVALAGTWVVPPPSELAGMSNIAIADLASTA